MKKEKQTLPEALDELRQSFATVFERELGWMERFLYWLNDRSFVQWLGRSRPFRWLP